MDTDDILYEFSCLLSESGENPEYDRAIVEATCVVLNLPISEGKQTAIEALISLKSPKLAPHTILKD